MSYHSKIDKLVESALGEMQPGLMAKVSLICNQLEVQHGVTPKNYCSLWILT